MHVLRRRLRPFAFIALVAMMALALLPTISRALAFGSGDTSLAQICTPKGMKTVVFDLAGADEPSPVQDPAAAHLVDCPYCTLGADHAPLPLAAATTSAMAAPADAVPRLFLHAPRTLFAWASAQPRAPPILS